MVRVYMFPVGVGDFLWIRYGKGNETDYNIIIDGGHEKYSSIYSRVLKTIANSKQNVLIVMTHIDADHIQAAAQGLANLPAELLENVVEKIYFNTSRGIMEAFHKLGEDLNFELSQYPEDKIEVCKNSMNHSVQDAEKFLDMIERKYLKSKLVEYTISGTEVEYHGAQLRFISPGESEAEKLLCYIGEYKREEELHYTSSTTLTQTDLDDLKNKKLGNDQSITNRSSLAFIFEYEDVKGAFLGDAASPVMCKGLEKLGINAPYPVDFIKLPHHGGNNNTSDKLLKMLPTKNFLISTEGVPKHGVPSKVLIAHLLKVCKSVKLYNNFAWWSTAYNDQYFTEADKKRHIDNGELELVKLSTNTKSIKEGLELFSLFR